MRRTKWIKETEAEPAPPSRDATEIAEAVDEDEAIPKKKNRKSCSQHQRPPFMSSNDSSSSVSSTPNLSISSSVVATSTATTHIIGSFVPVVRRRVNDPFQNDADSTYNTSTNNNDKNNRNTTTQNIDGNNNNINSSMLRTNRTNRSTMSGATNNDERNQGRDKMGFYEDDIDVAVLHGDNVDDDNSNNDNQVIDFLQDPPSQMTWSRILALFLLRRFRWYNPRLGMDNTFTPDQIEIVGSSTRQLGRVDSGTAVGITNTQARAQSLELMNQAYPFTHSRKENPNLEKAWAYFEHVALSRYVVTNTETKVKKCIVTRIIRRICCKGNQQLQKAEPGERDLPTRLYRPIFTPHKQLGDFGLGIGLYFTTLRAITVLTFLAGLLNIPNFRFFAGSGYNGPINQRARVSLPMQGSAVCVHTTWVPCPDCGQYNRTYDASRIRYGTILQDGEPQWNTMNMTFALKNNCNGATYQQAFINLGTIALIVVGTLAMNVYVRRMEVAFDEDEQTAQDYSILIANPPGDAHDPREWHKYFYDNFDGAHVTALTIAVDNDLLVRSLVERREILRQLEITLEPGTSMDTLTLAGISAKIEHDRKFFGHFLAKFVSGIPELFGKIVVINAKVQGLAQQDYPVTKVFVTFETEAAQRRVLTALSYGHRDTSKNRISAAKDPKHLFRGKHLLAVTEADEPNTVRWQDLNEKFIDKLRQQAFTTLATICAILAIAFIIRITNDRSVVFAAFAISIFNSVFPMFAKFLTDLEAHGSEGDKQRSLYFKIAMFRWVNTAVVITIITPFTATLSSSGGLISQIYALFFAEIVTTNVIQVLDPFGHLQRHFLAPRAHTQDAMNINMQGQEVELAERYTNMTKILFLALWYSAIFPGALFLCSFALFVNYFVDRCSLMRTWKRAPQLGTKISEFSRRYFFSLAIFAMVLLSSYYWASFPFDNLCVDDSTNVTIEGEWMLMDRMGNTMNLSLRNETAVPTHRRCVQDFFRFPRGSRAFPFLSKYQIEGDEWMTEEQEFIADFFGWTVVAVFGLIVLSFLWSWSEFIQNYYRGSYAPRGEDQNINFSEVPSISAYVPQVTSKVFSYPLLACNMDNVDKKLLDWTDPDRPDFVFYDLTRDAEVLLRGMDVSSKKVFSQVWHFPPSSASVMTTTTLTRHVSDDDHGQGQKQSACDSSS